MTTLPINYQEFPLTFSAYQPFEIGSTPLKSNYLILRGISELKNIRVKITSVLCTYGDKQRFRGK